MTITPRRIFWPAQRIAGQTAGCRFDTEMPKTGVRRSPFSSVRSLAATKTESCVRPRPATPSRHAPRKQVRGASAKATPHRATMRSANPNQRNRTGICKQGECRSGHGHFPLEPVAALPARLITQYPAEVSTLPAGSSRCWWQSACRLQLASAAGWKER